MIFQTLSAILRARSREISLADIARVSRCLGLPRTLARGFRTILARRSTKPKPCAAVGRVESEQAGNVRADSGWRL